METQEWIPVKLIAYVPGNVSFLYFLNKLGLILILLFFDQTTTASASGNSHPVNLCAYA
jgi:hypothetical protein